MRALCAALALMLGLCLPAEAERTASPRASVEIQRTATRVRVGAGGETTVLYRLENAGDLPATNVRLTDSLCGAVAEIDRLEPGESRRYSVEITITKACASQPTVTWLSEGQPMDSTLAPLSLVPAQNDMRLSLSADAASVAGGAEVTLTLRITNAGNADLGALRVRDAALGDMGEVGRTLAPGEWCEFTARAKVFEATRYQFAVSALSASGDEVRAESNAVQVEVLPTDAVVRVSLIAMPESVRIGRPGTVAFTLRFENETAREIRDVRVSEMRAGALRDIAVLPPGITDVVCDCDVSEGGEVQFLAEMALPDVGWHAVLSNEVTVAIGPGGDEPEAEEGLASLRAPKALDADRAAYPALLYAGFGALSLCALGAAAAATRRRRLKRRRHAARVRAMRRMRQRARMDEVEWVRTRPHKPVGGGDE